MQTLKVGTGPTATYGYDPARNPLMILNGTAAQDQRFTWDKRGKLATLKIGPNGAPTQSASYLYDPDGNLVARTNNSTTTLYVGGDELTITGGVVTTAVRYYPLTGAPTAVRKATTPGASTLRYQAADPQGTATVEITADLSTTTDASSDPSATCAPTHLDRWQRVPRRQPRCHHRTHQPRCPPIQPHPRPLPHCRPHPRPRRSPTMERLLLRRRPHRTTTHWRRRRRPRLRPQLPTRPRPQHRATQG